jgi:hypothetical protein
VRWQQREAHRAGDESRHEGAGRPPEGGWLVRDLEGGQHPRIFRGLL